MDNINTLICYLMAIQNYSKDIHYNCKGENFYGNHLFADRIGEGIDNNIDTLKEVCLLGRGTKPLKSTEYLAKCLNFIPETIGFQNMRELLENTLRHIESMGNLSKGDENIIGAIAQDIQNNIGLINIMQG